MSSDLDQRGKEELARQILAYLEDHLDAGDTLEGIVQWWLLECKIFQQTAAVQDALRYLAEQNLIVVEDRIRGRPIYRIKGR